jgi:hypothetical protein
MSEYFDNKDLFLEPKVKQYGNHMVMTNVMKPTKRKYYNIDTKFREDYDEYSTTNQFIYNITLPQRINDVKSIMVSSVEIPLSYYNISALLGNNTFQIVRDIDNIKLTVVIPDGNYDITSLINVINTQITTTNLSSNSELKFFDINFISVNNHISIRSSDTYTFNFAIKTTMTNSGISQNTDTDKFNFKSKIGWLLGFRNIIYNSFYGKTTLSEAFYDLNGSKYLYLVVDEYNNGNQNSFVSPLYTSILNKNILAKICIDNNHYDFGKILTANNFNGYLLTDHRCYNGKIDLQRLKIQLVNEIGLPIDLNGLDFSFTLEIDYE